MKIRNKAVLAYDIEVFRNIFHCTVKNTETNEIHLFEISERKNQLIELVSFFKQFENRKGLWSEVYTIEYTYDTDIIFVGYNNIHYDNPMINYIIDWHKAFAKMSVEQICLSLYTLSREILYNKESEDDWKEWKYQQWYESFDLLTMLYSTQLRVGLKDMQITMQYPNVQEFVVDWTKPLDLSLFDEMIKYNLNDVDSTVELLNRCEEQIDLRLEIENEYGVKVLSKDGVNIGMKIITQKYLEKTRKTWNQIKDLRSPMDYIALKDVILPFIKYKDKKLNSMLEELKQQVVPPGRKGYEYKFIYNNLRYNIGVGGIHSQNDPEIIIPKEDEMLIDIDVASLYPSILIQYEFYPKHLGREFLEVYSRIREERLEAKRMGNKVKNETLKLALNGLSGNLQNEHNFCYSPFAVMQIRINGQLLLLMLAEALSELGCRIVQANTDGLFVLLKKDKYEQVNKACRDWEVLTKLELEEDRFEGMYQLAINDYIAIKEGYAETKNKKLIKTKGIFNTKVLLGKGLSPKVIPEAIINYFADNIPIEDTIRNCKDIRRFLQAEKTGKQWTVEYNNTEQQRTNRFYVSTNGLYLWKWKLDDREYIKIKGRSIRNPKIGQKEYQNMLVGYGVTLHNTLTPELPISSYNINYSYYILQATKIINQLKPQQLSLWDLPNYNITYPSIAA